MDNQQRTTLLRTADPAPGEAWADLGCGDGTLSRILAEIIGPAGSLLLVDKDAAAIERLRRVSRTWSDENPAYTFRSEQITELGPLPPLEGILLANVLHYVPGPSEVLRTVSRALKPGGRLLVIEYDRSDPNTWVPHPIPTAALPEIARQAGITPFYVRARVPSDYGRVIYAAVSTKST